MAGITLKKQKCLFLIVVPQKLGKTLIRLDQKDAYSTLKIYK